MKTVAEVISRSNLVERLQQHPPRRIGRPPLPDEEFLLSDTGAPHLAAAVSKIIDDRYAVQTDNCGMQTYYPFDRLSGGAGGLSGVTGGLEPLH
jgi:hypothetical protein